MNQDAPERPDDRVPPLPSAGAGRGEGGEPDRRIRYLFPRSRRLLRPAEFRRVYATKQVFIDRELILHAAANGGRPTRLGMAISRKIGGAVRRNRIKRLMREAFRLNQHRFPDGLDMVLVPRKGAQLTLETISASLCKLLPRAAYVLLRPPLPPAGAPQGTGGTEGDGPGPAAMPKRPHP